MELKKNREKELTEGADINTENFKLKMQETQLVIEQLIWLTNLSENILKTIQTLIKPEKQKEINATTSFESNNLAT